MPAASPPGPPGSGAGPPRPPERPERLAFLGTPPLAVPVLRALREAGHDVVLAVSRGDARRGRGGALVASPVKAAARDLGIPVSDRPDDLLDAGVDLAVVVAFGRIIKPHLLAAVPMVNLHFSLLPRWRGAAPVERAILAGDQRTGVCLMAVEEGLDTGGVYARAEVPIGPDDTVEEVRGRLVELGTRLLLDALERGFGEPRPQVGDPTYAAKIAPEERRIDWAAPALQVHRQVRIGGAWTTHAGRRLKVWRTAVPPRGDGPTVAAGPDPGEAVELVEVQPEGKPRMRGRAWANGAHWVDGGRLGP